MQFSDDVVLITGAAKGIGAATARTFAERGATVVVTDVDVEGGREVVADIEDEGGDATFAELDVTDSEAFRNVVDATIEEHGSLDVLCNNAGISGPKGTIDEVSESGRDGVFEVNVDGVWNGCRAAVPVMREQGEGAIVNTASVGGLRGYSALLPYAISKAAVVNLTQSLAGQVGPDGIRVNAVCPAHVETPMFEAFLESFDDPDAMRAAAAEDHVLNRLAQPTEIANCIVFLASDMASFVTGSAFNVDGGYETVMQ